MTTDQIINTKLSDIISNNFYAVEVFEKFNFNYSIYGNRTLGKVCKENKIKPEKVVSEYNNLNIYSALHFKFSEWDAIFLCDYIVTNHHSYVRKAFPVLIRSAAYLEKRELIEKQIPEKLKIMEYDFLVHLQKEEKFLFPQIKKIYECELNNEKYDIPPFGTISNPVKVMHKEHEIAYDNFSDIKKECRNFKTKKTDIEKIGEFYKMLKEFEIDLHLHFHFENNLLFPKAIKTEKKLIKNNSNKHINRNKNKIKK